MQSLCKASLILSLQVPLLLWLRPSNALVAPPQAFSALPTKATVVYENKLSHEHSKALRRRDSKLFISSIDEDVTLKVGVAELKDDVSSGFMKPASSLPFPEEVLGTIALFTVPVLWGTYGPLVRLMYELETPMPGFVFSSLYFTLAAVVTSGLSVMDTSADGDDSLTIPERVSGLFKDATTVIAGVELGFYVLLANLFQVVGLETVSSDQAGFLMQMTTVLVPLVSAIIARNPKAVDGRTWLACLVAFAGIIIMNVDPSQDPSSVMSILSSFSGGQGLILCSALLYTMNVIRIGEYAGKTDPLRLCAVKATVEASLSWALVGSLVWLVGDSSGMELTTAPPDGLITFAETTGQSIADFFSAMSTRFSEGTLSAGLLGKMGGAVAWAGLMCTAFVVSAQSYGQRLVKASDANLIYSLQPIFTAGFASLLLGEQMDSKGFLGGGIILSAVLLVATKNMGNESPSKETTK